MFAKNRWFTRILVVLTLSVLAMLANFIFFVNPSQATPGSGVKAEVLTRGTIPESIKAVFNGSFHVKAKVGQIVMVKYTIVPGGVFGWHRHGGPVWVVVDSGTLSYYSSDDPGCEAINYPEGSAFMDPGDHTHNARNDGNVDLVVYATFMTPAGADLRIDKPDPGNCTFSNASTIGRP